MRASAAASLAIVTLIFCASPAGARTVHRARGHVTRRARVARHHAHAKRRKLAHAAGWAGAGAVASHVAGPAGSAAVGAAKYRKDLKRNWHTRRRAMTKIGAPIAAGAVAGPVGTAGYEGFEHRRCIKRHLAPHKRLHRRVRQVRHRRAR